MLKVYTTKDVQIAIEYALKFDSKQPTNWIVRRAAYYLRERFAIFKQVKIIDSYSADHHGLSIGNYRQVKIDPTRKDIAKTLKDVRKIYKYYK